MTTAKTNVRVGGPFFGLVRVGQGVGLVLAVTVMAQEPNNAFYLYLGNYPNGANPGWQEQAQGLAHDRDNWYITQEMVLWKIPVTNSLNRVSPDDPGVIRTNLWTISELYDLGYDHFGDPEHFETNGQGFLFVPVEHGPCDGLAVFRGGNLHYITYACLTGQVQASWCALDPRGYVYASDSVNVTSVNRYSINWTALVNNGALILTPASALDLRDESGRALTLQHVQGGAISPSGELLYVVAGAWHESLPTDGIHVFEVSTGRRVQRSSNGSGYFNYEIHNGFPAWEEAEGMTIWDLDDDQAPGITGQLHVLMLDQDDTIQGDEDDIYLKHYSGTIHVDHDYVGAEHGTPQNPFNTVGEANDLAWNGASIKIKAGSYLETLTFSKRLTVLAGGGTVIIGN